MRSVAQSGLSREMVLMSSRISTLKRGRPSWVVRVRLGQPAQPDRSQWSLGPVLRGRRGPRRRWLPASLEDAKRQSRRPPSSSRG